MNDRYLQKTAMIDYESPAICTLVEKLEFCDLPTRERIGKAYDFVRNEIAFGYNIDDRIPASRVLADGYGQCNTKGTLFMALLRAAGIPCRTHGSTVDKKMQEGAMTGFVYRNAPDEIFHTWVEVYDGEKWCNLEGFILDEDYLSALQQKFSDCRAGFCGYGVAADDFQNPPVEWEGGDTYIQSKAILRDLGVFDSPDEFFAQYAQMLSPFKRFSFRHHARHQMNANVEKIRNGK